MRHTRKMLPAALAAAGTVLVIAGCGGGNQPAAESASPGALAPGAELSGEIEFWHAYSEGGPEVAAMEDVVIPAFEEAHPGVTVTPVTVQYDQLHQKLVTAVAGGQLPCVVRSDIIWVPELAALGVLEPLSDSMPDFQEIADRTFPGPLATNLWEGTYYGLPLDTNTKVLLYNQDALDAAGVGVPATFDDLVDAAPSFGNGDYLFAEGGAGGWNLLPFIWSGGGEMTDEDVTTADGYLNGPESVAAVQMLVDLYSDGAIPPTILGAEGQTPTSEGLAQGVYATIIDGPWTTPILQSSEQYADFEIGYAPIPDGGGGSISVVGGEDVVITKSCENKDLAAEFARYLLSDEAQVAMAEVGQLSVISELGPQMVEIQPYYAEYMTQLETARPRPPTPAWSRIDDILNTQVQRALQGEVTVQEALDEAVAQIDPLLAAG